MLVIRGAYIQGLIFEILRYVDITESTAINSFWLFTALKFLGLCHLKHAFKRRKNLF